MTYLGIDTAAQITAPQAAKLKASGVSFVGRYLAEPDNPKALTAQEIAVLREAGLAILLCWETTAARMKGGAVAGAYDGELAAMYARSLGVPAGTVIFFAADYDVPASDFAAVEAYLRQAKNASDEFGVGLYGPEAVVAEMSRCGVCYYFWQCCAWSNQFLPVADVRQYAWQGAAEAQAMAKKCGIVAVDLDSAETLAGMWLPPVQPAPDPPQPWYAADMAWMERNSLMMDGRPNDNLTRAELAAVVHRLEERRYSGLLED